MVIIAAVVSDQLQVAELTRLGRVRVVQLDLDREDLSRLHGEALGYREHQLPVALRPHAG